MNTSTVTPEQFFNTPNDSALIQEGSALEWIVDKEQEPHVPKGLIIRKMKGKKLTAYGYWINHCPIGGCQPMSEREKWSQKAVERLKEFETEIFSVLSPYNTAVIAKNTPEQRNKRKFCSEDHQRIPHDKKTKLKPVISSGHNMPTANTGGPAVNQNTQLIPSGNTIPSDGNFMSLNSTGLLLNLNTDVPGGMLDFLSSNELGTLTDFGGAQISVSDIVQKEEKGKGVVRNPTLTPLSVSAPGAQDFSATQQIGFNPNFDQLMRELMANTSPRAFSAVKQALDNVQTPVKGGPSTAILKSAIPQCGPINTNYPPVLYDPQLEEMLFGEKVDPTKLDPKFLLEVIKDQRQLYGAFTTVIQGTIIPEPLSKDQNQSDTDKWKESADLEEVEKHNEVGLTPNQQTPTRSEHISATLKFPPNFTSEPHVSGKNPLATSRGSLSMNPSSSASLMLYTTTPKQSGEDNLLLQEHISKIERKKRSFDNSEDEMETKEEKEMRREKEYEESQKNLKTDDKKKFSPPSTLGILSIKGNSTFKSRKERRTEAPPSSQHELSQSTNALKPCVECHLLTDETCPECPSSLHRKCGDSDRKGKTLCKNCVTFSNF